MEGVVGTHPSFEVTFRVGVGRPLEAALRGHNGGGVVSSSQLEGTPQRTAEVPPLGSPL